MELENIVTYESNVAYHAHEEFIQRRACNTEMVPPEAGSDRTSSKKYSESMKIELVKIKQTLVAMILIVAVLVVTTLTAAIFSVLSYRMSKLDNDLDNGIPHNITLQSYCGAGQWHRIAFLNMSDPSQQCPSAWREYMYNASGVRACGRTYSTEGSCSGVAYGTENIAYSRVCGRIVGYQIASPDAFNTQNLVLNLSKTVIESDMDGVKITHSDSGIHHYHIWSFIGGLTENSSHLSIKSNCPCSFINGSRSPSHIGCNYYCESGNPTEIYENNQIFSIDPLWDGQQCEGTCCTSTNFPPWFSVQLPAPTTDKIEVSICADESTDNEDTPIKLLEIYIQ